MPVPTWFWSDIVGKPFFKRAIWAWWFRLPGYWTVVAVVVWLFYRSFARLPAADTIGVIVRAFQGDMSRISTQDFAVSLAVALGAFAIGFFVASLIFHWILVSLAIREARSIVEGAGTKADFAAHYEEISRRLEEHPLLGHAWAGFDGTLVTSDGVIRNTFRPHVFFNLGALRERMLGLKIMPGIPGYFVGLGLLFTFIGLVLALSEAAAGTTAAHMADGAGAQAMQGALGKLLNAATFKFSTSIAGLAASIVLSFAFRLFNIGVESSLSQFCQALEKELDYLAPQKVTTEMAEKLDAQLAELKMINSEEFFSRLGQDIGPPMQQAMYSAIAPLVDQIGNAVGELKSDSQSGIEGLLARFTDSVQGGAGAELRELAASLNSMQGALEEARQGISGSGEDFSRRMSAAAENLNRLVAEAGQSLGKSSEQSRETLEHMLGALRASFEEANKKVDENLAQSATGASARLESAMGRVLDHLEGQVGGLREAMGGFQDSAAGFVDQTQRKVAEAQAQSVEGIARASTEAAAALKSGLAEAMADIRREVETFAASLRASQTSLGAQTQAIDAAAARSRDAADAIGQSAQAIRAAVDPVTRSNEKLAGATQAMTEALGRSLASLDESQKAAVSLSQSITTQSDRVTETWREYEKRFGKVDEDLGQAFEKLAMETRKQAELLQDHTKKIDMALAGAVDRLAPFVKELGDGAHDLQDAVDDLKTTLMTRTAHHEMVDADS